MNNTFYHLPEAATFTDWKNRAPTGFTFALKASRFLTHMKKLKAPAEPLDRLFSRSSRLGRLACHEGVRRAPRFCLLQQRLWWACPRDAARLRNVAAGSPAAEAIYGEIIAAGFAYQVLEALAKFVAAKSTRRDGGDLAAESSP